MNKGVMILISTSNKNKQYLSNWCENVLGYLLEFEKWKQRALPLSYPLFKDSSEQEYKRWNLRFCVGKSDWM